MKLRDLFLTEFKIANQPDPTDREDYKAKMASLQDIQKGPRRNDARTQAHIAKRKEELRRWAEKNLKTEDNVQERMPASVIKSKQRYADMTDQELADRFKDSDEKTLRQMAWRHGYGNMSSHYFDRVQKGKSQTEDGVQATDLKRMGAEVKSLYVHKNGKTIMIPAERENDFIQKGYKRSALRTEDNMGFSDKEIKMAYGVLNNPKYKGGNMTGAVEVINKIAPGLADHPSVAKALQTTNEGSMVVDKTAFVQILANKIKEPQKGHGKPEYDNRLLAKMYQLISGQDVEYDGDKFTVQVSKKESAVQEKESPYTTDKEGAGWIMANKDKIITQLYAGGIQSVLDPKDAVKAISDLIPDVTEKQIIDIIKKDDAFAGETAVKEDSGDEAMAKEIAKLYDYALDYITDTSNNDPEDGDELRYGVDWGDHSDAEDLAAAFREKGLQAGLKLQKELLNKRKAEGKPDYQNKWDPLYPESMYYDDAKKILARQKESAVQEDISDKGRIALEKAGFDPMKVKEYMAVFNDHGDTSDIDQMNMDKVGLADAMGIVLASHDIKNESVNEGTYLDEGWLDTLKAAGRKIVPDQIRALYDPATAAKVQADDQAKVQMQTLFKDINTVAGLNQTDVSQGYPADLVVAYLRKYVEPKHPDAFKRMDAQGDLKKMFPAGQKINPGTLKGNLNKIAIELGKVNLSPDQGKQPTQQPTQQPQAVAASIDNEDSVKEGANMIPYFKTEKDFDGEKHTVYEFPMAWAKDKELDTPYMSNASMREFLTGLGYSADFEEMSAVPVEEFIGVTTQWLKKHIDKQSPKQDTTVDKEPGGPTMISGGKPEGHMNQQVKLHNELARKIKQRYPEVTHLGFN